MKTKEFFLNAWVIIVTLIFLPKLICSSRRQERLEKINPECSWY